MIPNRKRSCSIQDSILQTRSVRKLPAVTCSRAEASFKSRSSLCVIEPEEIRDKFPWSSPVRSLVINKKVESENFSGTRMAALNWSFSFKVPPNCFTPLLVTNYYTFYPKRRSKQRDRDHKVVGAKALTLKKNNVSPLKPRYFFN